MTLQQCHAALSGNGGFCRPNPFYTGRQANRDDWQTRRQY
ncbi:MAG: hypothetical protein EXQ83_07160 [Xanthobacteraceae bacterium]|nr:hypothetical protein [Xanthobacteraceae bacterium]